MNITKQDVVNKLKEYYPNLIGSIRTRGGSKKELSDVVLEIIDDLSPVWIDVDDRLPEEDTTVLCFGFVADDNYDLFLNRCGFGRLDCGTVEFNNLKNGCVTHWMSLPKNTEDV